MRISDVLPRFLDDTCRTKQSRDGFRATMLQLQSKFPGLLLADYRTKHLTEFCLANNPAPNTVRTRRSRLLSFFAWAEWQGHVPASPAGNLRFTAKPGRGGGVTQHNWMSEEDLGLLLQAQPNTPEGQRARMVVLLGVFLGLRRSELAMIRWASFTPDLSRVSLIGKGRKLAQLGVPPQLRIELQAWRRMAPVGCQTVLPAITTGRWSTQVREFQWGRPVGSHTVGDVVVEAGRVAGIDLSTHDLRRTFAGMLETQGMDIKDISRLMRHSNIGTTSVYLEQNPNRVAGLADGFTINLGVAK